MIALDESLKKRFWSKVQKSDGCWVWTASLQKKAGYGQLMIRSDGRPHLAHRISWLIAKGEMPDDLLVLHKCDNRRCVNPDHLFLGTNKDNVNDMWLKNRQGTNFHKRLCKNGHSQNERTFRLENNGYRGSRRCLACKEGYDRTRYQQKGMPNG